MPLVAMQRLFFFFSRNVAGSLSAAEFLSDRAEVQGQTLSFFLSLFFLFLFPHNYPSVRRYFLGSWYGLVHKHRSYYFRLDDWGSDWDEDKMDHWASRIDWVTPNVGLIISSVWKVRTFLEKVVDVVVVVVVVVVVEDRLEFDRL